METCETVVLLLSGGIDSTVLLHLLKSEGYRIHTLSVKYGQRHSRELDCARWQAQQVQVQQFHILEMNFLASLLSARSALFSGGTDVPTLEDIPLEERHQPPTYVPNRNMILLALSAAYAESIGARRVFYGAQAQDEYGYWDCTPQFLERLNAVLDLNRGQRVQVQAPLIHNSKADNLRLGTELGVDFSMTWSCYRGEEKACGVCPTCVERLHAFKEAHIVDPLPYATPGI